MVFSLLEPGGPFVNPVTTTDAFDVISAMAEGAAFSHVTATILTFAMVPIFYGFVQIWRSAPDESATHFLIRIGILSSALALLCFTLTRGLTHIILHIVQHETNPEAPIQASSYTLLSLKVALRYSGSLFLHTGLLLLAIGLSIRFPRGFQKIVALLVIVISTIGVIAAIITEHVHGTDFQLIFRLNRSLISVSSIWLIVLGIGMYRGIAALNPSASSGSEANSRPR